MAVTNPADIRFCNEKIRPAADRLVQAFSFAERVLNEWNARDGVSRIPNDAGETVQDSAYGTDGADGDGRPIIDGAQVNNVMNRISELVNDYKANSSAKLNTILQVAVNTG